MANVKKYYAPKNQHFTIRYDPVHGMVASGMKVAEEQEGLREAAVIGDIPIKLICDDGYLIVIDDTGPIAPRGTEMSKPSRTPLKGRKRTPR